MTTNEKFLHHAPCEDCGSRDNLGIYENHTYCFGCHKYTAGGETTEITKPKIIRNMITGEYEPLSKHTKIELYKASFFVLRSKSDQPF